ncbi:FAD-dependent monooxygenase [Basilea psittacipulmonis]|uniref:FAD-binding domain-containing protein n=1 Tax=Basilea psittacipulmonis DSM 24701 TaxID=1072685 RepID=A0A077DDX7_9BURK|nr:FAD-dependent monooxygenase [Basilea psittacipulmonis]AIL33070.1 hypothetical protein IX83_06905 [Basilea psittacipulmonis DSM 24701]
MNSFDIAILGAGPVGLSLASALAQMSQGKLKIALFQDKTPVLDPKTDKRVLALNYGSQVFLEKYHLWPEHIAPIEHVHVSQKGYLGRTIITLQDLKVPTLGACVNYAELWLTMQQAYLDGVTIFSSGKAFVQKISNPDFVVVSQQSPIAASSTSQEIYARLAIQCDGSQSHDIDKPYHQSALITAATVQFPQAGWAWERFTQEGPLAVLPHPSIPNAQSIVWCTTPEKAEYLKQLDDPTFSQALTQHFGERLGKFSVCDTRVVFPLALKASRTLVNGRHIVLGNAAQTMHPVAGQGLNLGLRDVACLTLSLRDWIIRPQANPQAYLKDFEKRRFLDRRLTWSLTDTLPRITTANCSLIHHACGLGLMGMDAIAPLRALLGNHLLKGYRT